MQGQISLIMTAQCLEQKETAIHPTVVIYDVLRATSTITTALAHRAREIIPVLETDEALSLYDRLRPTTARLLLGGERFGDPIPGFHLGNSPLEYTPDKVKDKTIIFTTTNGTRAMINSQQQGARKIIIASILNQHKVIDFLKDEPAITVVCAGVKGQFAYEDFFAAGLMLGELLTVRPDYLLDDSALAALELTRGKKINPEEIARGWAGIRLKNKKRWADVQFCATANLFPVLPVFHNHRVELGSWDCSK